MLAPGTFTRRSILGAAILGLAAPAIVRAASLMPINQALCYGPEDLHLYDVIQLKPTPTRILPVEIGHVIPKVRRRLPLELAKKLRIDGVNDLFSDDPDERELWEMRADQVAIGDRFKRIIMKPEADPGLELETYRYQSPVEILKGETCIFDGRTGELHLTRKLTP